MITIKVSGIKLNEMKSFYKDYLVDNNGEYVAWMAKVDDLIITAYLGKKELKKVTFNGPNALLEAKIWDPEAGENVTKEKPVEHWIDLNDQIGSDEVGVGDFLLPMIVVASYVKKSDVKKLISLGVHDSKKINDNKIIEIGKELVKFVEFSKLTITNEKYNEMIAKGENINSLKAKMHNRALLNLTKKHPEVVGVYIDQFVSKEKYYEYLNDKEEAKVTGVGFKTKGESSFPCVACSSIIARYAFLMELEELNKKYKMDFPKGASTQANEFAKKFIAKYGTEEFKKIAKANFSNYKEVSAVKLI